MSKCVSVLIVLVMTSSVFARDCEKILDSNVADNCDECIRCGGNWCNEIGRQNKHCLSMSRDNWCPAHRESFPEFEEIANKGSVFNPQYVRARAFVGGQLTTDIEILRPPPVKGGRLQPYAKIISTTQHIKDNSTVQVVMKGSRLMVVTTNIQDDFCFPNSTRTESIQVKVGLWGQSEEVTLDFEVPCACGCSERVERNSSQCSFFGDLSCGVCHCREKRTGDRCERKKCTDRGDTPPTCYSSSQPDVQCSGNGRCDECNVCECFNDVSIEGSQYFHPDSHCEDICSMTSKCGECLKNPEPGICDSCGTAETSVYIQNVNESLLDETENGRKVWVQCNATLHDCGLVQYAAMERNGVQVMVMAACSNDYLAAAGRPITVPVVALAALLAAALLAAAGYAAWARRPAPLQPLDPQYSNIGGEDCVGVNPLYVDPTSSFKNPMYGKGA